MVMFGNRIVSVTDVAIAVPLDVAHARVSDQNCLDVSASVVNA